MEIPGTVNASLAEFTGTLLATVEGVPLNVSTKVTVPVGVSGLLFATTVGLMLDCRNRVCGACPLVNVANPGPSATSTLPVVVLPAFVTVTVTGAETLGANVPSPEYRAVT